MRVTILTTSFPEYPGDLIGNFVLEFAKELARQGQQVRVITSHSSITPTKNTISLSTGECVEVVRFRYFYPARWEKVNYGYGIPENLRLSVAARIGLLPFLLMFGLKTVRFRQTTDVYHAQWVISGLIAVLGKMIHRKPIILTVRGSDLNLVKGTLLRWLVQYVLQHVTLITTVSEKLREKVIASGVPAVKVHTIPNGVDCTLFSPVPKHVVREQLGLPLEKKVVLWMGRFIPIKGLEYLMRAIPTVLASDPDVVFVFVGSGGEIEAEIKQMAQALPQAAQVLFAGKVSSEQSPLWMNAADVLVLPSLNEGRPNVILEAMACEVPVVATQVGGIPELVTHGENGFLVAPENAHDLAQALIVLLRDEALRLNMGKTGRQKIFESGLSWQQCAQQMKQLYQHVMTDRQQL